jgi:hypothetical protein
MNAIKKRSNTTISIHVLKIKEKRKKKKRTTFCSLPHYKYLQSKNSIVLQFYI